MPGSRMKNGTSAEWKSGPNPYRIIGGPTTSTPSTQPATSVPLSRSAAPESESSRAADEATCARST